MTGSSDDLVIDLSGPGWRAALAVRPPDPATRRSAVFDVPALGVPDGPLHRVTVDMLYTEAVNLLASGDEWARWHVKVYRCASAGDAEALRLYLRRQAAEIRRANAELEGPSRTPLAPPWAVVPVHVVRGDGQQDSLDGAVLTQLAGSPQTIADRVRATLPDWFADRVPSPERYLLAASPHVEHLVWSPFLTWPATEQLVAFTGMAAGLDTLHRLGMVHCDIKPDNVCRYRTGNVSGFVLIDTDAATRTHPAPTTLRVTELYSYAGVRRWQAGEARYGAPLHPDVLRAHDRFGFALVVLAALAGRDWVERVLLLWGADEHGAEPRPADDRARVVEALRRHWPDSAERNWGPLIDAVSEPFGPPIEDPAWSARDWVRRLIAAERSCVVGRAPGRTTGLPGTDPGPWRRDLDRVLREVHALPTPKSGLMAAGYEVVERRALAVAAREAVVAATLSSGALLGIFVLVMCVWGLMT